MLFDTRARRSRGAGLSRGLGAGLREAGFRLAVAFFEAMAWLSSYSRLGGSAIETGPSGRRNRRAASELAAPTGALGVHGAPGRRRDRRAASELAAATRAVRVEGAAVRGGRVRRNRRAGAELAAAEAALRIRHALLLGIRAGQRPPHSSGARDEEDGKHTQQTLQAHRSSLLQRPTPTRRRGETARKRSRLARA